MSDLTTPVKPAWWPHFSSPLRSTVIVTARNGSVDAVCNLDDGCRVRLISPNRPGVLNTKWLSRMEVI